MSRQEALIAARNKAVIASFLRDRAMWNEALRLYFFAIGGRAKKH
ncbi:host cell division inhibitory peptide Kil [Pantoea agglomerans]